MSVSSIRPLLLAAVTLAVSACTSVGTQKTPAPEVVYTVSPAAERAEEARVQALRAQPDYAFQGRVAVSKGKNGGSGRIDWVQQGSEYRVQLSAPVTRQSWTLQGDALQGGARLEGLGDGPRTGDDARLLLLDATGWDIPVSELSDWTRGLVLRGSGESAVERDAEGRPRRMQQAGWLIQYLDWYPAQDGRPALPRRIEASREDAKVRLLVDQWGADAP
ncbi:MULTISPECIES: lipoprotein insertase outer membrane protein LolB [Stenotrophomonas]|uniref:lipoprotein insertase outer membrane protein LolB n=1 Tax=Stenotrophomonas TaxID=40323 RepID=UPI000D540967|nr:MULTISPECIES: lipoprotein insertase outer membrane protein LolB [Stenotrophomonas]AWH28162.1 lipoprotein localization factor LolB [Stenotrophomonas sp. YAU14A_MKIMI4_1]AWH32099.1 lipoprotein localization factor LolB [Stenotrophomonas sp. SAU14A_NAIMI4_8]